MRVLVLLAAIVMLVMVPASAPYAQSPADITSLDGVNQALDAAKAEKTRLEGEIIKIGNGPKLPGESDQDEFNRKRDATRTARRALKAINKQIDALEDRQEELEDEKEEKEDKEKGGDKETQNPHADGWHAGDHGMPMRSEWTALTTDCGPCEDLVEQFNSTMTQVLYARYKIKLISWEKEGFRSAREPMVKQNGRRYPEMAVDFTEALAAYDKRIHEASKLEAALEKNAKHLARLIAGCEKQCKDLGDDTTGIAIGGFGGWVPSSSTGNATTDLPFDWQGPFSSDCPKCDKLAKELNKFPKEAYRIMDRIFFAQHHLDSYNTAIAWERAANSPFFKRDLVPDGSMPTTESIKKERERLEGVLAEYRAELEKLRQDFNNKLAEFLGCDDKCRDPNDQPEDDTPSTGSTGSTDSTPSTSGGLGGLLGNLFGGGNNGQSSGHSSTGSTGTTPSTGGGLGGLLGGLFGGGAHGSSPTNQLPFDWKGPYVTNCGPCKKLVGALNGLPKKARKVMKDLQDTKQELDMLSSAPELDNERKRLKANIELHQGNLKKIADYHVTVSGMLRNCEAKYCKKPTSSNSTGASCSPIGSAPPGSDCTIELEGQTTVSGTNPFDDQAVENIPGMVTGTTTTSGGGGGGGGGVVVGAFFTASGTINFVHTVGTSPCSQAAGTIAITSTNGENLSVGAVTVSGTLSTRLDTFINNNGTQNPSIDVFFNCSSATTGMFTGAITSTITEAGAFTNDTLNYPATGTVQ